MRHTYTHMSKNVFWWYQLQAIEPHPPEYDVKCNQAGEGASQRLPLHTETCPIVLATTAYWTACKMNTIAVK